MTTVASGFLFGLGVFFVVAAVGAFAFALTAKPMDAQSDDFADGMVVTGYAGAVLGIALIVAVVAVRVLW
jgi:hypothetical protein